MKAIFSVLAIFFFSFSSLLFSQEKRQYVFFLHNKFLEDHSFTEKHPQYGIAEYAPIIKKLEEKNTVVISEKRKPGTDLKVYARKIIAQIDSLRSKGIPYRNMTIVGTSQGGYISQYVSYYSKNPELKFVIIGSSFKDDSLNEDKDFKLYGKILSITEKSDDGYTLLSSQKRFLTAHLKTFKEIELNTGLHHGFLFQASDAWILPTLQWIHMN